ncbi:MAG: GNAT family N-acetyltransferase [Eubacteriales bacterium]|nr:GNAT family N-acetyltransferase [Eubacteriales bacterium]
MDITLRPLARGDAEIIYSWISDSELRRMIGTRGEPTPKTHRVWFQNKLNDKENLTFMIMRGDTPVGLAGTNTMDEINKEAEVYLYLGSEEFRGQGIGKQALGLLTDLLFDEYDRERVVARIFSFNTPSIRLFEKAGFVLTKNLRAQVLDAKSGTLADLLWYARVRPDTVLPKKIMILGAGILQLPAIRKALDMGLRVVAVDMNPDAVGFREKGIEREVISTIDIPEVVKAAKRHGVDGVMTLASDMPMRTVAAVAEEMGLVGIDAATAKRATDKAEMRKALAKYGVPIPKFFKVSDREEYDRAAASFRVPFIVKPADNSGSRGICKIDDPRDAAAVAAAYDYSRSASRSGDVVVEEYMNGPEVSVETLTVDGVCHVIQITDKMTTGSPHFVETGHTQPTRLPLDVATAIRRVAVAATRAIGIKNGPSHTEIIVTEEGPKIVELGARLGGDCITTHLVPLSTGVDMVACCIRIALGQKPDIMRRYRKGAAIRYFESRRGVLKRIGGVEEASRLRGVRQISFVYQIGDTVPDVKSSGDRIGFVIAQAGDAEKAAAICEEVKKRVVIEIDDGESAS